MPVIPALEKLRQEDHEFKASLGYTAYFTKTKNRRERERENDGEASRSLPSFDSVTQCPSCLLF
jgi:hypothetical protein